MKAKTLIALALLALLVSTMACGGGSNKEPTRSPIASSIAGYLLYTDEANGFSVSYPEDWTQESLEAALIGFFDPDC